MRPRRRRVAITATGSYDGASRRSMCGTRSERRLVGAELGPGCETRPPAGPRSFTLPQGDREDHRNAEHGDDASDNDLEAAALGVPHGARLGVSLHGSPCAVLRNGMEADHDRDATSAPPTQNKHLRRARAAACKERRQPSSYRRIGGQPWRTHGSPLAGRRRRRAPWRGACPARYLFRSSSFQYFRAPAATPTASPVFVIG